MYPCLSSVSFVQSVSVSFVCVVRSKCARVSRLCRSFKLCPMSLVCVVRSKCVLCLSSVSFVQSVSYVSRLCRSFTVCPCLSSVSFVQSVSYVSRLCRSFKVCPVSLVCVVRSKCARVSRLCRLFKVCPCLSPVSFIQSVRLHIRFVFLFVFQLFVCIIAPFILYWYKGQTSVAVPQRNLATKRKCTPVP